MDSVYCLIKYVFSTPSSTAIFFSVTISSLLSILIFLASGWREKRKSGREMKLEKIEELFNKIHKYSRTSKMYLWSIRLENQEIVQNRQLAEEARELIYECEVFKFLHFENLPLDPAYQYAEMERIGGKCDRIWMGVKGEGATDIQEQLEACKMTGNEIKKLDELLKPVKDWCLEVAKNNQ